MSDHFGALCVKGLGYHKSAKFGQTENARCDKTSSSVFSKQVLEPQ